MGSAKNRERMKVCFERCEAEKKRNVLFNVDWVTWQHAIPEVVQFWASDTMFMTIWASVHVHING